jgi:hypothetical protein
MRIHADWNTKLPPIWCKISPNLLASESSGANDFSSGECRGSFTFSSTLPKLLENGKSFDLK